MRDPVLNWDTRDSIMVVTHDQDVPPDTRWAGLMEAMDRERPTRFIAFITGDARLRARQRTDFAGRARKAEMVALVLGAGTPRSIAAGLSWFLSNLQVFAPNEVDEAIRSLDLTDAQASWALETLRRLRAD